MCFSSFRFSGSDYRYCFDSMVQMIARVIIPLGSII